MDNQWVEVLKGALVFGVPLTILASTIIQLIKRKFNLEGDNAYLLALGVGTLIGFGYLALFFPLLSWQDGLLKFVAALMFAFLTPEFYGLLKATSAKGMSDHIEAEEQKILNG